MRPRLGDILVRRGFVSKEQLERTLELQRASGVRLGELLIHAGHITQQQLGEALEEQIGIPFHAIVPEEINPQIARLLPEHLCREYEMIPVGVRRDCMQLAMAFPQNVDALVEAETISGYRIEPFVSMDSHVKAALDTIFDEQSAARQTVIDMKLDELSKLGSLVTESNKEEDESEAAPVVRLVRSIFLGAVTAEASDIHLEPHVPEMRVRYRVDGELEKVMTIPKHIEEAVVSRIKVMADMSITETRRPQDGKLILEDGDVRVNMRVSTVPVSGGEKVVLRLVDDGAKTFTLQSIGLSTKQFDSVQTLLDKPHGMFVVTGPTGSGKTTTLYAMLSHLNTEHRNIVTVEDPVETRIPGLNQVSANAEHGLGFANALKYFLRQDPDVILVGEIRDRETATTAVQASLTGHLLMSTLHTNDAVGAVQRLNDLGVDRFKISGCLLGSVAQRLLRRICPDCKQPCEPHEAMLRPLLGGRDLPADATFFHGRGCSRCLGTGYTGRMAIYEIMVVDPDVREAIEAGASINDLREMLITQKGMIDLAAGGLEQVLAGRTTLEEVYYKLSS
jgi:type IV pilus assembly protein PilB